MQTFAVRITWIATDVYSSIIRLEATDEENAKAAALQLAEMGCHFGSIKWLASGDPRDFEVSEAWKE